MHDNDRLPETVSWVRSSQLSRRQALATGVAATGFALAVQPVAATTLHTDSTGLTEGTVQLMTGNGTIPAYRALRTGGGHAPVVVVIHEIFGLHEWLRDVVRRFAKAGFYAIAPDLYARNGDASKIADIKTLIETIVSKADDSQVQMDIEAAIAQAAHEGADISRTGVTGFCWGGRQTWLTAASNPKFKAGVAWYGGLKGQTNPLRPKHPIDLVGQLHAPVLGLYGGLDKGIPQTDVEAMRAALVAVKSPSKIIVYPEADHGFLADYRPSYNEAAAKAGWDECLKWFGTYLR